MKRLPIKNDIILWGILSLGIYLSSFRGMQTANALISDELRSEDLFGFELITPIIISAIIGRLVMAAVAMVASWQLGRAVSSSEVERSQHVEQSSRIWKICLALTYGKHRQDFADAWHHSMAACVGRKRLYPWFAFAGSIATQWYLEHRIADVRSIKDYTPPDSWVFGNLAFFGLSLLLAVPFLRRGPIWQRIVAALLCVWPAINLAEAFYYVFTELAGS